MAVWLVLTSSVAMDVTVSVTIIIILCLVVWIG